MRGASGLQALVGTTSGRASGNEVAKLPTVGENNTYGYIMLSKHNVDVLRYIR